MNLYFFAAGCLTFIVGLIHSVLGEVRIFRTLTEKSLQESTGEMPKKRHRQILRVTWHLSTLFGWAFGALLLRFSLPEASLESQAFTSHAFTKIVITTAFSLASLLTLLGTEGKHPGWIGLLAVAILVWLG